MEIEIPNTSMDGLLLDVKGTKLRALRCHFQDLSLVEKGGFEMVVTDLEICNAIFGMAPLKASGADGFHAKFYQTQCDTVGPSVCSMRLGHLIDEVVNNERWKPLVLLKGGPALSHLFFADDLMLFGEVDLKQGGPQFFGDHILIRKPTLLKWDDCCRPVEVGIFFGPLRNFFVGFEQPDDTLRVCDLVNEFRNWDWIRLKSFLPNPIVMQIALLLPSSLDAGNDRLLWRWAARNALSMAKTYRGKDKVFRIEARSMLEGLQLVWGKGYRQVELESDNALLVELILASKSIDSQFKKLWAIHKLIQVNWKVCIHHIPRVDNAIADFLAKHAAIGFTSIQVFF
ncbi:hypothetical protein PVK06_010661 [Gossypium arboreum]|uniref:RNase H type-1 domain-containing protein n=1 Tax=Gossypium arboreum TaxID=29729 RepID=A0ABR0Q7E4_GOSAR|nr:hypothetical protein PVK06_010661 [Gossypium arboreum]